MSAQPTEAWLLHLDNELHAAIGVREMLYVLPDEPVMHPIPRAPAHASRVLVWQQQLLPVIDLHTYLAPGHEPGSRKVVGIISGSSVTGEATLGALLMSRAPDRVAVSDAQACGLPDRPARWRSITVSCFRHPRYGAVPILDVGAILARGS